VKKYILAMAIVAATGVLIERGCGGPGGRTTQLIVEPPGLIAVFGGDAPQCSSVISFGPWRGRTTAWSTPLGLGCLRRHRHPQVETCGYSPVGPCRGR
jgi:hypothetical protein